MATEKGNLDIKGVAVVSVVGVVSTLVGLGLWFKVIPWGISKIKMPKKPAENTNSGTV